MAYIYNKNTQTSYEDRIIKATINETGEQIDVRMQNAKHYGGKRWLKYFDESDKVIMTLSEKNSAVFLFIIHNMDRKDNVLDATYEEIAKGACVSFKSVTRAMDTFELCDFIRMKRRGKWIVNPYMVMQGDEQKQGRIACSFLALDRKKNCEHTNKEENNMMDGWNDEWDKW